MTEWRIVASENELPAGGSLEVVVGSSVVAIFRTADGLYAIEGMCAHQGGPIARGQVSQNCVTCPWHGWQYDLATGNNAVTLKPMLATYEIRERDGKIEIKIEGSST